MRPQPGVALTSAMVALTLTTGVVEAVSFLVLGPVFTAVQTGNLLLLGIAFGGGDGLSPAASAASLGGFATGVVLGTHFTERIKARGHRWLVGALCAEAALLGVAGLAGWGIEAVGRTPTARHYAVTATVAGAMGLQAVAAMRARVPDVPTVVVTRTLVVLLSVPPLAPPAANTPSGPRHQGRRAAAFGAMLTGAWLGAGLLHLSVSPGAVLLAAAGGVLAVGLGYGYVPHRRPPRPDRPAGPTPAPD
ncbi:YoaK family protein [Streptomyces sp. HNM0663]|uniref:YoaK family protein n=1 Tax=Streptomyces chengmaiensis TaxID=3040919 RepID=A0ABT6HW16_9ACTN|nr:YoaK family protein [Streptomyces chengmaiensis]MDH2392522.1 YoaK family protein [Streptomyces chengmaiensis]